MRPACDAVLLDPRSGSRGQPGNTLEYLEHANLFIVPLDNERRWYRYHHLFADLLRQRLQPELNTASSTGGCTKADVNELHIRASQWYEDNGLELEAFHHAAAANDFERAERLIEGKGCPCIFAARRPGLNWLEVAAGDGPGCQTLVVGDVCLDIVVWRAADRRRSETSGCRIGHGRCSRRCLTATALRQINIKANKTTKTETLPVELPRCGPRWR